jgi:hypothetical protein
MSVELREAELIDSKATETRPPKTSPLEKAIQSVRRDSREASQEYLDETEVPYGGE